MPATPAIEVTGLSRVTKPGDEVPSLCFSALPGELICLFGDSGSGKTRILQALAGHTALREATIRVMGDPPRAGNAVVAFVRDDPVFSSRTTPSAAIMRSAALRGVPKGLRIARTEELLDLFDLQLMRDRPLRELSRGMHQSVAVATALAAHPKLLLLDSPTAHMPPRASERMWLEIEARRLVEEMTVVYSTLEGFEAERADRVVLLHEGKQVAFNTPDALIASAPAETVTIESCDPDAVRRTLRGRFDILMEETAGGMRFTTVDGAAVAAHLFRHPSEGIRALHVRKPTLWDVLERLSSSSA